MTAPRAREHAGPQSPPDRQPPRRGGGSSPSTYAASAAVRPAGIARLRDARRALFRSARALAAAALLTLSGALALPAQAQTTCTVPPGDLWCGVLTIGTATFPGVTSHGYVRAGNTGSLSPNSFTREGTPFTVDKVAHDVYSAFDHNLEIVTSPALPSGYNFVLQAGSQSFSFAGGETNYYFDPSGLDWSMSDGETVTLRLRETPSDNATLSGLAVNDGSSDLALSPAFAPDTTSYTAYALMAVDEVTVTPTTLNPNSTIAWLDGNDMTLADADTAAGQQVSLDPGENVIKMKVTSQDNSTTKTYTVTVTRAAVGPPAAPAGFSATAGNLRVALDWNALASDAVITHHEYRYKTDGAYPDAWKEIPFSAPGGVNGDGFSVTELDNGTAYTFQLRAANGAEKSDAVESSAVTPSGHGRIVESITIRRDDGQDGEPYGIGDKIVFLASFSQNVVCVDESAGTPRVVFDLGASRKRAALTTSGAAPRFEYEYTVAEGDVDSDGIVIPAGPTALPNGYYAVSGCRDRFDESGINAQGPLSDRKVDGVYPSLDSAVVNGTALVLTWDETLRDDSVPAGGDFTVTVAGASRAVSSVAVDGEKVMLTLASAVTGRRTVTVSYTKGTNPLKDLASNDAPGLTDEAVRNSRTTPLEPTNLSTSEVGDGSVTLVWDAPASDADITRHEYRYKTGGSYPAQWTPIPNSGAGGANAARYRVTGLTNNTAYTFQVRAVNGSIEGAEAETGPATPAPPPVSFTSCTPNPGDVWCGAVTVGKVATRRGRTLRRGFHATWHAGSDSDGVGGLPDRRFVYGSNRYKIDEVTVGAGKMAGFLFFSLDRPLPAADRARLVLHVGSERFLLSEAHRAGRTHTFHWRGTGLDWSSTSSVTPRLRADLPAAPTGVTAVAPPRTGGLLEVSWTAPAGGASVTGYEVRYCKDGDGGGRLCRTRLTGSTATSVLLYPFLDAETEYRLRVRARTAIGGGAWSAPAVATTGAVQPGKPVMSLQVIDDSGNDIDRVTAGGKVRYRIKLTNIRNHHLTFDGGSDHEPDEHGWGTLGLRGGYAMDFDLDRGPVVSGERTCIGGPLLLSDFKGTSETSGYWEFVSPALPSDADERGPLRLRLGFECTEKHGGASTEIDGIVEEFPPSDGVVETTSGLLTLGSPNRACLSVEDDQGTVTNACGSNEAGTRALTAQFESAPAQHDGTEPVKVRVSFSEAPENVGADGVRVEGGRVTSSKRVDGSPQGGGQARTGPRSGGGGNAGSQDREVVWEFEIQPFSGEDLTVTLEAGRPCDEEGAICTSDGRSLSEEITTTVEGPETGPPALTASFEDMPEAHDGERAFKLRIAFSEPLSRMSGRRLRSEVVAVAGGRATKAGRVKRRRDLWKVTVEPDSLADVTVTLAAGAACGAPAAVCTSDGRALSNSISTTVAGPAAPLTAAFEAMPEAHDGQSLFRFRVAFSEDIGISDRSLRMHAFTVTGGRVTGGGRVDGRRDLFEITVRPDSVGDLTIALAAGRECRVSGAICTGSEPRRQLTNAVTATVAGPAGAPLTAAFEGMPAEHDGESPFTFRIAFSDGISRFQGWMWQFYGVSVAGGRKSAGEKVDNRKDLWELTVQPRTYEDIVLVLAPGPACGKTGAVCTRDGRALSNMVTATVLGPVAVSVADARAEEGEDETIDFAVTLSRASSGPVTVAYATADGSATAGADYTATNGTLTFTPGETGKTVSVPVLDDAHDEGEETLTFRLTTPSGAVLADGEATGTIENSDPLQRAWLARFGRTAATHVTDAVGDRLWGTPGQGSHITVGGSRLPVGQRGATDGADDGVSGVERLVLALGQRLGLGTGTAPAGAGGVAGAGGWPDVPVATDPRLGQSRTLDVGNALNLRQVLLGSSFRLAFGRDDAGSSSLRLTVWGRVAGTTFDGRDGRLTLDGDVLTGTVGVDGEWDRLLAGLAVAHSRGDGSFSMPGTEDRGRGGLENTLTSVHPYLRYAVNDRLAVWGLFGYGWGELDLEMDNGMTIETDTNLVMGAFGGRGILLAAAESGGFQLATRTDAMLTRTTSDKVAEMESAEADAHRLRLVLEGSRGFAWAEGRRLTPTMEVGLRHDWGDAETGFGLELGGRVQYADPALGLTIEAAVRGLLAHEDSDYEEWGASGTVRVAPGAMGQGLSLTLAPAWGATASGVDGLWSRQTTAGLAPQGNRAAPVGRLNAEIGYGVAAPFGTGLLTPYAGTVLSDGADRTYRVGTRLQMSGRGTTGLQVSLEGTRQEPAGQQPVNQGLRLQATWRF